MRLLHGALPFSGSSPMLSRPTAAIRARGGRARTRSRCARTAPAPRESSRRWRPSRARRSADARSERACRSRGGEGPRAVEQSTDAAICAPVLPAETNASDCPSAWRRRPTTIELCGLPRTAVGLSDISMTSGASTIVRRSRCARCAAQLAGEQRRELVLDDVAAADELDCMRRRSSASASSAPATVARGAKSPPMASNAMRAKVRLPAPRFAAHPRSTRTRHRRGAGASCLTLRAILDRDRGSGLVRVAGALLPLGGTALRDGHGSTGRWWTVWASVDTRSRPR